MLYRKGWLVCACLAAGLLLGVVISGAMPAAAQGSAPDDPEKIPAPENVATETVELLKASKQGDLKVVGAGRGKTVFA